MNFELEFGIGLGEYDDQNVLPETYDNIPVPVVILLDYSSVFL